MNFLGYPERLDILERIHEGQSARRIAREGGYGKVTVAAVADRAGVMATLLWHLIDGEPPEGPFRQPATMPWGEAVVAIKRIVPGVLAEYLDPLRPIEPYSGRSPEVYVPPRRQRVGYFSAPAVRDRARGLVEQGMDDVAVAGAIGFSRTTVYYWRTRYGWAAPYATRRPRLGRRPAVQEPEPGWVLLPHTWPERPEPIGRIHPAGPTPKRRCQACCAMTSETPCPNCGQPWAWSA